MRILVSSFDKTMVEKLRHLLMGEDTIFVKNGEEAIKARPQDVDLIIYDAVSGVVSENDVNSMFDKAFKSSKYIILMDDLFPIDPDNLKMPSKIVISRDRELAVIPELIKKYKEISQKPKTENTMPKTQPPIQNIPKNPSLSHTELTIGVVSRDEKLLKNIEESIKDIAYLKIFSDKIEKQELLNTDIIIYDTTEGVSAAKELISIYQDSDVPVIIILDDMFPIDISRIPIRKKIGIIRAEIESSLKTLLLKLISDYNIRPKSPVKNDSSLNRLSEVLSMDSSKSHLKDIIVDVLREEIKNTVKESMAGVDFKELARTAIQSQIATEDIKTLMLNSVNDIVSNMRNEIMNIATKEIERAIKEEDIKTIIKDITASILKERIESLLA